MRGLLVRWAVCALALYLTSSIVRGIEIAGLVPLLVAAAVIGIINAFVRPVVLVLTLPISVLSLGVFVLIVNAAMLWLASTFVPGFEIRSFWSAFWGWLVLSFLTFVINVLIGEHGRIEVVELRSY